MPKLRQKQATYGRGRGASSDDNRAGDELVIVGERTWSQRAEEICFQLLFYMVHGNNSEALIEYVALFLEDFQLFFFLVSKTAGTIYEVPPVLANSFDLTYNRSDLQSYEATMILSVVGVTCMLVNIAFVADGIRRGQHKFIWPIFSLRIVSSWIPTVFQLTILRIFFTALLCINGKNNGVCTFNTPVYMIAIVPLCLVLYLPMGWLISSNFFDTNPTHKSPTNVVHGKLVAMYSICKIILTILWIMLPTSLNTLKMVIVWLVPTVMLVFINIYFPYYNLRLNQIRGGMFSSISTCGFIAVASCVARQFNGGTLLPITVFISMAVSTIPTFIGGFLITGMNLRRIQRNCYKRLTKDLAQPGQGENNEKRRQTHDDNVLVFSSWPEVELTARIYTSHLTNRKRYTSALDLDEVYRIFKRGLREFPDNPQVRLSYATYLFYLQSDKNDFIKQLRRVADMNSSIGVRFQVFYLNQICNQSRETTQLGSNIKLDVTSYAEFRKIDRQARMDHQLAENCVRDIWNLLMTEREDKDKLFRELQSISFSLHCLCTNVDHHYSELIAKFPKSKMYLRLYAKFCYEVVGDTFKGNTLSQRASMLEKIEMTSRSQSLSSSENIASFRKKSRVDEYGDEMQGEDNGRRISGYGFEGDNGGLVKRRPSRNDGRDEDGGQAVSPYGDPRTEYANGGESIDSLAAAHASTDEVAQNEERRDQYSRSKGIEDDAEESRSAASHPSVDHAATILRSRLKLRCKADLRSLSIGSIVVGISVLILLVLSVVLINDFMAKSSGMIESNYMSQVRRYLVAMEFRRARQLQKYYLAGDRTLFAATQAKLLTEMAQLDEVTWELFKAEQHLQSQMISINITAFPGVSRKVAVNLPIFETMESLQYTGVALATMAFDSFATISQNNYFRYITENFANIQAAAFDGFTEVDLFADQLSTAYTTIMSTSVIVAIKGILCAFLVFRFLVITKKFVDKQRHVYEVFLKIPKKLIKEQQLFWEEAAEQDLLGVGDTVAPKSGQFKLFTINRVALQIEIACLIFMTLACSFLTGYFTITSVNNVNTNFVLLNNFGAVQTYTCRATSLVNEMYTFDNFTWASQAVLAQTFLRDYRLVFGYSRDILYGVNKGGMSAPGMTRYDPELKALFSSTSCLVRDEAVCKYRADNPNWTTNATIKSAVSGGIAKLILFKLSALSNIANGLSAGGLDPAKTDLNFLETVLEPDLMDGWSSAINVTHALTNNLIYMALLDNLIILLFEVIMIILAEFLVFWRTVRYCRNLDTSAIELIVHLPPEIKRDVRFLAALEPLLAAPKRRKWSRFAFIRCCFRRSRHRQVHPSDGGSTKSQSTQDMSESDTNDDNDVLVLLAEAARYTKRAESRSSFDSNLKSSHEQLFVDDDEEDAADGPGEGHIVADETVPDIPDFDVSVDANASSPFGNKTEGSTKDDVKGTSDVGTLPLENVA